MELYPIIDYEYYIHHNIALEKIKEAYKLDFFQIRIKNQNPDTVDEFLKILKKEFYDSLVIMNDYPEFLDRTDGLHLGIEDLENNKNFINFIINKNYKFSKSISEWLKTKNKIIGISTHNFDQFKKIYKDFLEFIGYLAIGPIFSTTTKRSHYSVLEEEEIVKILQFALSHQFKHSVVFIGGIHKNNLLFLYNLLKKNNFLHKFEFFYASISSFMNLEIPAKIHFT